MKLVCPGCLRNDLLFSCETTKIMYPAEPELDQHGGFGVGYTGEHYEVLDEGTTFENDLYCRNCAQERQQNDLYPTATCKACEEQIFYRGYTEPGEQIVLAAMLGTQWINSLGKTDCPSRGENELHLPAAA